MKKELWRTLLEALGLVSVVGSLVFVGLEVRQSGLSANDAALSNDNAIAVAIEDLVLGSPDVWRRGCLGEPLDPAEEVIFSHIHHMYVFQHFLRWMREHRGTGVSSGALSIDNLAMNIYRNPGFRREWEAHGRLRHQVPDKADLQVFRRLVDERVAQYPAIEPTPMVDVSRCGLN